MIAQHKESRRTGYQNSMWAMLHRQCFGDAQKVQTIVGETVLYPGSFLWRRISDEWLLSRSASVLFFLCSITILGMSSIFLTDFESRTFGLLGNVLLAVAGMSGAVSVFFLWGGMWRYWIGCDSSTSPVRRIWFLVLVVGLWYGAILYFGAVYLMQRHQRQGPNSIHSSDV